MKSIGTKCLFVKVTSRPPENKCDACGNDRNPQSNSVTQPHTPFANQTLNP